MLFIEYPKCTTCQKAKKWLDDNHLTYIDRDIKNDKPTYLELKKWYEMSGLDIKKLFNISGLVYKSLNLKDKMDQLTIDEKLHLLASDGMLVKRPIVITDSKAFFGFKESSWTELLK